MVFAGNQDEAACESVFAQSLRRGVTRCAAADNNEQLFIFRISLAHLRRSAIRRAVGNAHDDLIVFNLHFIAWERVEGGRLLQMAGRNVETGVMPGTNESLTIEYTFHERRAVV